MEKLNVGVVGCGNISRIYLKNLTALFENVRVTVCCDLDAERAKKGAEAAGAR